MVSPLSGEKGYKMYVEPTIPTLNSLQVLLLDGKQPCILAELASQETVSLSLFFTTSLG